MYIRGILLVNARKVSLEKIPTQSLAVSHYWLWIGMRLQFLRVDPNFAPGHLQGTRYKRNVSISNRYRTGTLLVQYIRAVIVFSDYKVQTEYSVY